MTPPAPLRSAGMPNARVGFENGNGVTEPANSDHDHPSLARLDDGGERRRVRGALSYRSVRGSPSCGKTLVSPNQVIADIRSPSSVRTNNAYARAISACALGR